MNLKILQQCGKITEITVNIGPIPRLKLVVQVKELSVRSDVVGISKWFQMNSNKTQCGEITRII